MWVLTSSKMETDTRWSELSLKTRLQILLVTWIVTTFPFAAAFNGGLLPFVISGGLTLLLPLASILSKKADEIMFEATITGGILVAGLLIVFVLGYFVRIILWQTIGIPLVSAAEYAMSVPYVTSGIVFGVIGLSVIGIVYASWKTGSAVNWKLTLRMMVSMILLAVLTIVLFTAIWRLIEITAKFSMSFVGIDAETQSLVTILLGIWLFAAFLYLEVDEIGTIDRHGDATTVSSDEYPLLHSITTRVASQFDIPKPTIAVSEHTQSEAFTRGYRPGNIHLVLSQGTLDALDEDELEAVVAHELAHVANIDAVVMTVASLPFVLADGLQDRADAMFLDHTSGDDADSDDDSERGPVKSILRVVIFGPLLILGILLLPVVIVLTVIAGPPNHVIGGALSVIAVFMKYLSRFAVSILSRTRESVADRTAATVIGSPMALASALRTLDERITETPSEDLRESSSLSTLSILPLDPVEVHVFVPSEVDGIKQSINTILTRIARALFATHPPAERRIDALTAISENR